MRKKFKEKMETFFGRRNMWDIIEREAEEILSALREAHPRAEHIVLVVEGEAVKVLEAGELTPEGLREVARELREKYPHAKEVKFYTYPPELFL